MLAPGGLLLNFDANWYRYLWDAEAEQGHRQDRENLADSDVRDENAGTDVDAMEAIARQTCCPQAAPAPVGPECTGQLRNPGQCG